MLKKIRKERPPCENIIDLIDVIDSSVGKCIVLPFLGNVTYSLALGRKGKLHGRYIKASRDVARGVAFLHKLGIAHRDIKPANLLYTDTYTVKIADLDVSIEVKDEDALVTGYIGSEGWMAPEIGESDDEDRWYSPIKADRYSCGLVFRRFAQAHEGDDEGLESFASRLLSKEPNARPQLKDWDHEVCQTTGGDDEASSSDKMLVEKEKAKTDDRPLKRRHSTVYMPRRLLPVSVF